MCWVKKPKFQLFRSSANSLRTKLLIILVFQLLIFFPVTQRSESQSPETLTRQLLTSSWLLPDIFVQDIPVERFQLGPAVPEKPVWNIALSSCVVLKARKKTKKYSIPGRIKPFEYGRLERDIWKELVNLKKRKLLVPGDEVSVRILDLTGGRLLASISADKKRMAASLIKPFVMLAVYEQVHRGKLKRNKRLERLLRRMIVVSNNWATNRLLRILGRGDLKKGLRVVNVVIRKYRFYHTKMVEMIPPGGKTYKNYTTARDLSRFFYLLYHKRLVSQYYSELMMKKFLDVRTSRVRTYIIRKDGSPVADKTGFVCGLNGDAGIVFQSKAIPGGRDYIFVLMIENKNKPHSRRWRCHKTRVLRRLSNKIYLAFKVHAIKQRGVKVVSL